MWPSDVRVTNERNCSINNEQNLRYELKLQARSTKNKNPDEP